MMIPKLHHKDTLLRKSVSPTERLIVTLRCLSIGNSYACLHFQFRLGRSTIYYIVQSTCKALWSVLKSQVMATPTEEKWREIIEVFWQRCNFPNCIGAIDGKHIRMVMPPFSGSKYYNYKKFYSMVMLAVVDAEYRFVYVDIGSYGSTSDSAIFSKNKLVQMMTDDTLKIPGDRPWPGTVEPAYPFTFIGDEAFGLSKNMMRPYSKRCLNYNKHIFNYRISRARRMVECTFGILANKWRILHTAIQMTPDNTTNVIKACCVLHNFVREREGVNFEDTLHTSLEQATWSNYRGNQSAFTIRDEMADYFLSPVGQVPWQDSFA